MNRAMRALAIAVPALLAGACGVTETGNPSLTGELALVGHTSDPSIATFDDTPGAIRIEEAWIVLGEARFVPEDACDSGGADRIDIEGPILADLAGLRVLERFVVPAGRYCRLRFRFEAAPSSLPAGAPGALADRSCLLRGTTPAGARFELASRQTPEIDLRSEVGAFELDDARDELLLVFDVAAWLAGIDLDSATPDATGVIRIDETTNAGLHDAFAANVRAAIELHRDVDGDGALDVDDELVAVER